MMASIALVVVTEALPPGALTRHVEFLGQGEDVMDVPLMTLYTAPAIPGERVDTTVSWTVRSRSEGPSTAYLFRWNPVSKALFPIRFILNTSELNGTVADGRIAPVENGFVLHPAGVCGSGCNELRITSSLGGAGLHNIFFEKWRVRYTVSNVTEAYGSSRTSFLEVRFSVTRSGTYGIEMPAANVSLPRPDEIATIFTEQMWSGETIQIQAPVDPPVPTVFRHNGTSLGFDAGRLGILRARLDSVFSWGSKDDYRLSFSSSTNTTLQVAIDLRFGSMLVRYV
jgi:hypothetical protein